ncbi:MAG TPA: YceI family protein [Candidatus Sulfotelmatobacter sp.]|jgi:polyisoprenoid-binding protein YceI
MAPQTEKLVTYAIDPKASQFTVQAFASGLISSVAHSPKIAIREYMASVNFVPGTLAEAKLKVVVKSASLQVLDELREADKRELHRVMYDEVLETTKFPEIVFQSSNISSDQIKENLNRVNVEGRLSLHGETNSQSFFAQLAFGVDSFRAYGEFSLLQSDFSIRIASIAGGTLKLQDELKFSFYVVGRKQS